VNVAAKCACSASHAGKRVVITGGPGAGKTAVLELARRQLCQHVRILPEAATILFGGGFPREQGEASRKAAQRAIFHVQRELESLVGDAGPAAVTLCDRGTVDGFAYWPGEGSEMFTELATTAQAEFSRYHTVIHLRTPSAANGYNHDNRLRTESALVAAAIDRRIELAWSGHPRRFFVASDSDFLVKASEAMALLNREVPACCHEDSDEATPVSFLHRAVRP
jgi:predicted ATPase